MLTIIHIDVLCSWIKSFVRWIPWWTMYNLRTIRWLFIKLITHSCYGLTFQLRIVSLQLPSVRNRRLATHAVTYSYLVTCKGLRGQYMTNYPDDIATLLPSAFTAEALKCDEWWCRKQKLRFCRPDCHGVAIRLSLSDRNFLCFFPFSGHKGNRQQRLLNTFEKFRSRRKQLIEKMLHCQNMYLFYFA